MPNIQKELAIILGAAVDVTSKLEGYPAEVKRKLVMNVYRKSRQVFLRGLLVGPIREGDLVTFLEEEKERFEDFARRKQPNWHLNKSDYHAVLAEMRRRQWRWLGAGYGWEPSKLPTKFNPYTGEKKS